jgi:hypothetical protein
MSWANRAIEIIRRYVPIKAIKLSLPISTELSYIVDKERTRAEIEKTFQRLGYREEWKDLTTSISPSEDEVIIPIVTNPLVYIFPEENEFDIKEIVSTKDSSLYLEFEPERVDRWVQQGRIEPKKVEHLLDELEENGYKIKLT